MDAALTSFYNGREDEFWNRPQTWNKREARDEQ